jgi:hypothetical protein
MKFINLSNVFSRKARVACNYLCKVVRAGIPEKATLLLDEIYGRVVKLDITSLCESEDSDANSDVATIYGHVAKL